MRSDSHTKCSAYMAQVGFDSFITGKSGHGTTRKAIVYDQFGPINKTAITVEGTRKEILDQYGFFKICHPDRHLGLVCPEYFELLRKDRQ